MMLRPAPTRWHTIWRMVALTCWVTLCVVGGARAQPAQQLWGEVVDDRGAPVAGATIIAGEVLVATDEHGRFEVAAPTSVVRVQIVAPSMEPLERDLQVPPSGARVRFVLQPQPSRGEVIEVREAAPLQPRLQRLGTAQARQVAGATGDTIKGVESLAGVARPPPGRGELVVWGTASRDTQVLVADVPIPSLYHVGGWRAALGGELVTEVALEPGAFGPRHGDAIGGVVAVQLDAPPDNGGDLAIDLLDVSAALHHRLPQGAVLGGTRVAASARTSYLDRLLTSVAPEAGRLVPVPRWTDASMMLSRPLAGGDLRVFGLASRDSLARLLDSEDPAQVKRQDLDRKFWRGAIEWRGPAAGGTGSVLAYAGEDRDDDRRRFGDVPAEIATHTIWLGARAEHVAASSPSTVLTLGGAMSWRPSQVTREGSLGSPAREGDIDIFGQPPGDDVAADSWRASTAVLAAYATLDWIFGSLVFTPGVRVDGYVLTSDRRAPRVKNTPTIAAESIEIVAAPRLAIEYRAHALTLGAAAGLYYQPRQPQDVSAVFGNPTLGLERAAHLALSGAYRFGPRLSLELTTYGRMLDHLVTRHPAATPPVAGALTQDGTGLVGGAQLTLRLDGEGAWSGWLSYGLSRSVRTDGPGQATRLFDHDQPHLLTAVLGWRRGPWSLGCRWRIASGEPRTLVTGSFVDARSGRMQPITGEHNGARLPMFVQLDLRIERRLAMPGGDLALALEIQNATARANAEEFVYSADYSERGALRGLPLIGVLGVRWQPRW